MYGRLFKPRRRIKEIDITREDNIVTIKCFYDKEVLLSYRDERPIPKVIKIGSCPHSFADVWSGDTPQTMRGLFKHREAIALYRVNTNRGIIFIIREY